MNIYSLFLTIQFKINLCYGCCTLLYQLVCYHNKSFFLVIGITLCFWFSHTLYKFVCMTIKFEI